MRSCSFKFHQSNTVYLSVSNDCFTMCLLNTTLFIDALESTLKSRWWCSWCHFYERCERVIPSTSAVARTTRQSVSQRRLLLGVLHLENPAVDWLAQWNTTRNTTQRSQVPHKGHKYWRGHFDWINKDTTHCSTQTIWQWHTGPSPEPHQLPLIALWL